MFAMALQNSRPWRQAGGQHRFGSHTCEQSEKLFIEFAKKYCFCLTTPRSCALSTATQACVQLHPSRDPAPDPPVSSVHTHSGVGDQPCCVLLVRTGVRGWQACVCHRSALRTDAGELSRNWRPPPGAWTREPKWTHAILPASVASGAQWRTAALVRHRHRRCIATGIACTILSSVGWLSASHNPSNHRRDDVRCKAAYTV